MLPTLHKAVVSISIDVPTEDSRGGTSAATSLTERLIEIFQRSAFAATWSLADPGASRWTQRLCDDPLGHEIALLGEADWMGPTAGRSRFCAELARRLDAAGRAGIRINTLALHGVEMAQDLDLLVRHRIALLRSDATSVRRRAASAGLRPQSARFGVWRAPIAGVLSGKASWWPGAANRLSRRAVRRVLPHAGFVHLVIDGARLVAEQSSHLGGIQRMLHFLRQHELRGALEIAPLYQASARWIKPRPAAPARSVLRHVA